jgi:hypothetical protein
METAVIIVDETGSGEVLRETKLVLASERVAARELIRKRIFAEVAAFNEKPGSVFQGLVKPEEAETELNGYRLRKARKINPETQCKKALDAFETNGFLMLANDKQIESLDEDIVVTPTTRVAFIKLVPLVGG